MKNLFNNSKMISASVLLAMSVAGSASAATIKFGSSSDLNGVAQVADDGSGLTSVNVPSDNLTDGGNGFFVETFDQGTQTYLPGTTIPFPVGSTAYNDTDTTAHVDCAVNGVGAGIQVTGNSADAFGVRKGSKSGVAASPAGDTTCFGYTPKEGGTVPSWVEVDYSAFLSNVGLGAINYLGFYWGSVETYNDFTFYNEDGTTTQLFGTEVLAAGNANSGSQNQPSANVYVEIVFDASEVFTKLRFTSNGVAGEFDNIVIGLSDREVPVPAPTGIALLVLGLLGLGLRNRLRK
jgi:hypothetical protein